MTARKEFEVPTLTEEATLAALTLGATQVSGGGGGTCDICN
jgi:hypothetical protein